MVTRDDVARRARTSTAVVSYVVNGGPRPVAEGTRARVEAAIAELGYQPNGLARALRTASTKALAVIVPDISNTFFAELCFSVESAALDAGYTLFLGSSLHDDHRQAAYLDAFAEHRVDGLLVVAASDRQHAQLVRLVERLHSRNVPVVLVDRRAGRMRASCVVVDNAGGALAATRHLLGHGHPRVHCLSGPPGLSSAAARTRGWRKAMSATRAGAREQYLVACEFDRDAAAEVCTAWLAGRHRPTAIFVHSDEQAIGVLHAARAVGLDVPADLAVVSFDGTREAAYTLPRLTTVDQPVAELGRRAVRLLLDRMRDRTADPVTETLPVALHVRESCGCPAPGRNGTERGGS